MYALRRWLDRLFFWRRGSHGGADEAACEPMISLVFFLREPRYLDSALLAHAIHQAWGIDLGSAGPDDSEFVVGEGISHVVSCRHGTFLVNNFPMPYMPNRQRCAAEMKEMRRQQAVLDHQAWLSIDFLRGDEPGADVEAAYRFIGSLGAELLDEDCVAAFCPETAQMNPYDDELGNRLRDRGAKLALEEPRSTPVLRVSADDSRIGAAVATARQRWPEFVAAFENRQPDESHLVKAPFGEGANVECMWVSVTALENDVIFGLLQNDPVNVPRVRKGDRVQIALADMNDWLTVSRDGSKGGFTLAAMNEAAND
jgi:uncharacterized protein YegJ (DUF2314 family)